MRTIVAMVVGLVLCAAAGTPARAEGPAAV
jgi:hypothetical protein